MSVLIKKMKMPKSCASCEWSSISGSNRGLYVYCKVAKLLGNLDIAKKQRIEGCPLVEVPTPHGSLIDSEEFKNMLELGVMTAQMLGSDENTSLDIHFMKEILKEMPTVIEAEE